VPSRVPGGSGRPSASGRTTSKLGSRTDVFTETRMRWPTGSFTGGGSGAATVADAPGAAPTRGLALGGAPAGVLGARAATDAGRAGGLEALVAWAAAGTGGGFDAEWLAACGAAEGADGGAEGTGGGADAAEGAAGIAGAPGISGADVTGSTSASSIEAGGPASDGRSAARSSSATAADNAAARASAPAPLAASTARLTQRMASSRLPFSHKAPATSRAVDTSLGSPATAAGTRIVTSLIAIS
jgi:hypothetical protein